MQKSEIIRLLREKVNGLLALLTTSKQFYGASCRPVWDELNDQIMDQERQLLLFQKLIMSLGPDAKDATLRTLDNRLCTLALEFRQFFRDFPKSIASKCVCHIDSVD